MSKVGTKKAADIALVALTVAAVAIAIVFGIPGIVSFSDARTGRLVADAVPRLAVCVPLAILLLRAEECRKYLLPSRRGLGKALVWCIPCFAVAVVNFPFSALIRGTAEVTRVDLLWLFLTKCAAIAVLEELFFRALLVPTVESRIGGRYATVWAALISAAIFGLMHIINLFFGAGVGATLLQVGYTFLVGAMLAVMLKVTGSVWLPVATHFVFDIGGMIITDIGRGAFQDTVFWALTVAVGVIAAVHTTATVVFKVRRAAATEKADESREDEKKE